MHIFFFKLFSCVLGIRFDDMKYCTCLALVGRQSVPLHWRPGYKGSLQCEHKFDYNFLYFLPDLRSWNSVHIFIVSLTIFSTSSQLVTNISMEEIISENMSKFCTGDVIIMYQLIVCAQVRMALSTAHYLAAICRQLGWCCQLAFNSSNIHFKIQEA